MVAVVVGTAKGAESPRKKSLRDAFDRFGTWNGTLYLASRSLTLLSGGHARLVRYQIVAQPVPSPSSTAKPSSIDVAIALAGDALVTEFPRERSINIQRFDDGAICIAASKAGHFVGHIWLSLARYDDDEVRASYLLEPPEATAWDFDVHIEPEYRLSRAFQRLWDGAFDYLRSRGVTATISRISAFNPESLAAHRRLGAEQVASATFVILGPIQIGVFTCAPFFDVSIRSSGRASLRVRAR